MSVRNLVAVVLFLFVTAFSRADDDVSLLPKPVDYVAGCCTFTIHKNVRIKTNVSKQTRKFFSDYLHDTFLSDASRSDNGDVRTIVLNVSSSLSMPDGAVHPDAYRLNTTEQRTITVEATSERAVFYALQTLIQLLDGKGRLRAAIVNDYPRFPYRGLMIDCSRHFWTKEHIMKQIDAMALYKFSYLHLHLTDAGGWRIESDIYPRLTEIGAFRTESDWDKWWTSGTDRRYVEMKNDDVKRLNNRYDRQDSHPYGGFYTKNDLREIVDYAAKRYITIVPEVEMPGHSEEVLAAYPQLSCVGEGSRGGEFCVGNEETFLFLENILGEVMDIFPSEYIHIGGDEASRKSWETCEKCQKRMAEERLSSTSELQSYMTKRVEKMLNKRGRKLLGWDEILEGGIAPNATVMSWRGVSGGIKAAQMNHHVVMSPGGYCYLDAYQDAPATQPRAFGSYTPLERTYSFEPVPAEMKGTDYEHYFDGIQGNLWTEMIQMPSHLDYMLWPRALAVAEVGWSRSHDDYNDFKTRVTEAVADLKRRGYNAFQIAEEVGSRKESSDVSDHEAIGKRVEYLAPYADVYKASGDGSLTDGLSGDWSYGDGRWQGFISKERFDVVVDMGCPTTLRDISVNFMQFAGPEIFAPASVEYLISDDGVDFKSLYIYNNEVSRQPDYFILPVEWTGATTARYVRVKAKAGNYGGWVFTDEVFINKK